MQARILVSGQPLPHSNRFCRIPTQSFSNRFSICLPPTSTLLLPSPRTPCQTDLAQFIHTLLACTLLLLLPTSATSPKRTPPPPLPPPRSSKLTTHSSLRVFRKFIKRVALPNGEGETLDASGIISKECFDHWVSTRKRAMNSMEKAFQRSLSAHLTASDGRSPFTPSEEFAILKVIRKKQRWPCFPETDTKYGAMGFRTKGFHERQWEEANNGKRWVFETSPDVVTAHKRPRSAVADVADAGQVFLSVASNLLAHPSHHTWGTILSLARMHLLVQSWTPPSQQDADAMLALYMGRFPANAVVVVCDLTCREMRNRVLAQSAQARVMFGDVCRNDEQGLHTEPLDNDADRWNALQAIVEAVRRPKLEQPVTVRLAHGQALLFMCAFPQERLLVVRAM